MKNRKKRGVLKKERKDGKGIDVLQGLGFRMERHGRFVLTDSRRTREEHEKLMLMFQKMTAKLPGEIQQKSKKLERKIAEFNSFDVIAHLMFKNMFNDPDTYKEYSDEGKHAYVEYVSLLCLKNDFSEGTPLLGQGDVEHIQASVDEIFNDALWLSISSGPNISKREAPSKIEELQFITKMSELMVRNNAYTHHLHNILRGLFNPFDNILLQNHGFTSEDILSVAESIPRFFNQAFQGRLREATRNGKRLLNAVLMHKANKGAPLDREIPRELVEELAKVRKRKLRVQIDAMASWWLFWGLGRTFSFSSKEISELTGIEEARIDRLLETFSLKFGDVPADFYIPSPVHPLKSKPLIAHDKRFICPSPSLLDWAIQENLENRIKRAGNKTWQRYLKHRHQYVLNRGIELLKNVMPKAEFETNLRYTINDGKSNVEAELDGLGRYDTILFLIECKSGGFTEAARRGRQERIKTHLKDLLGKAHAQAIRTSSYIDSSNVPGFKRKDGTVFNLSKEKICDKYLISLVLEPLGNLTSVIHLAGGLNLYQQGDLPWVVSLYDLEVISDMIDFPPMFPHYVERRIRVANQGLLQAHDELDIFAYYLCEGLYFESAKDLGGVNFINLMSYTDEFDAYYLCKTGVRKRQAPKPKQKMPKSYERLLNVIEATNMEGRVPVIMGLLDLGTEARRGLSQMISGVKEKCRRDNLMHNFTSIGEQDGGWGVTYACGPPKSVGKRLGGYCMMKKYQMKARRWYAIGDVSKTDYKIHMLGYFGYPWTHDEKMEQAVSTFEEAKQSVRKR